jgi:hypothetical protein
MEANIAAIVLAAGRSSRALLASPSRSERTPLLW